MILYGRSTMKTKAKSESVSKAAYPYPFVLSLATRFEPNECLRALTCAHRGSCERKLSLQCSGFLDFLSLELFEFVSL